MKIIETKKYALYTGPNVKERLEEYERNQPQSPSPEYSELIKTKLEELINIIQVSGYVGIGLRQQIDKLREEIQKVETQQGTYISD